jgi:hypothetical protein
MRAEFDGVAANMRADAEARLSTALDDARQSFKVRHND